MTRSRSSVQSLQARVAELKASSQWYRILYEHNPSMYFILDAAGTVLLVNRFGSEHLGYDVKDLVGQPVLQIFHADDREGVKKQLQACLQHPGKVFDWEFRKIHKDGSTMWVKEAACAVDDPNGHPIVLVACENISKRKQAEEALKESEARYRVLAENAYDLICETDLRGRFFYVSPNYTEVLGYTSEELLGKGIFDLMPATDVTAARASYKRSVETGAAAQMTFRLVPKDGSPRWFESTAKTYRTAAGALRAVIVSRDITERKRLDEELLKRSKLESLSVLARGIAHDFNNFLTAIISNLAIAKLDARPGSEQEKLLSEAEESAHEARGLTQQLSTFATGGGVPVKQTVTLPRFLRDAIRFALRGTEVTCKFAIAPNLWPVQIDTGQIGQVLSNLVINAVQAMPKGGQIELSAENVRLAAQNSYALNRGRYVKIAIQDHGVGIPEENIPRIFDPFFTTKDTGSGLGLSTCYSIIQNHQGNIFVESSPGKGTTICFFLPAAKRQAKGATRQKPDEKKTVYRKSRGKVLVMEDEDRVRVGIGRMLGHLGFQVAYAKNGAEAIHLYKQARHAERPFDVVIMDLSVPGGLGGRETLLNLQELDKDVCAIVSSGHFNDP
ncbi:MAG: PAS domain-containing sensor histidine kinase, partial [Calditrichaeota bacterium]